MPKPEFPTETQNYDDLSFEDAMEELESFVRGVDTNRLSLDEMVTGYERGTRLYKLCRKRLEEARGRIELIKKRNEESAELEAFGDSAAKPKAGAATRPVEDNDDESLNLKDGELF